VTAATIDVAGEATWSGSRSRAGLHAVTWLVWAVASATCVHLTPNPLTVAVVVAISWLVVQAHGVDGPLARAFPVLLAVGVGFGLFKVALTVLTTHGIGAALVTLPELTLPTLLGGFTVGGTIEDVVLARAVAEAFAIVGIMGAFGAFNACVSHDELVRSLPRAFHEAGVILTVGLAFVPATIASVRQAQESDRARTGGEVARRGRLVRLAVPLLERGMERAVLLSESMESRGFGRDAPRRSDRWAAALALLGSLGLGAALLALVGRANTLALVATGLATIALVAAVVVSGRSTQRTRYRPRPLTVRDAGVMGAALLAPIAVLALGATGAPHLRWPGDVLTVPAVDPLVLLALVPLAVPALVPTRQGTVA
jgi:energy-coupling factor transport system permease protein